MLSKDRNGSSAAAWMAGIGFGFAAGCLVGILYAPQAGRRTRRQLASAIEDHVENVRSKAQDASKSFRKNTLRFRNEAQDLLDQGQAVIAKGKAQMETALEKGADIYRMATR